MTIELKMPALSPTMEKGTLAKWLVAKGDRVRTGDVIAEVETDKATMEIESVDDGEILEFFVSEGTDDIPVGTVLAHLRMIDGDSVAHPENPSVAPAEPTADEAGAPPVFAEPPDREPKLAAGAENLPTPRETASGSANAGMLVQKLARVTGKDLASIGGSGPGGRIMLADLGHSLARHQEIDPIAAIVSPSAQTDQRITSGSNVAAMPRIYLIHCDVSRMIALNEAFAESGHGLGSEVALPSFVVRAIALALRDAVAINAAGSGGGVDIDVERRTGEEVHVAQVDRLALSAIARKLGAELSQDPAVRASVAFTAAAMTLTDVAFPRLDEGRVAAFAAGAALERPWPVDGEVKLSTVMTIAASFDARLFSADEAAQLLAALRNYIETPLLLVA